MPNSVFLGEREKVRQTVTEQTQAGLTCSKGATQSFSSWHNLQPSPPAYRHGSSGLWPPARNACARWASPASRVSAEDTHPPVCLHKPANDTPLHQQTIFHLTLLLKNSMRRGTRPNLHINKKCKKIKEKIKLHTKCGPISIKIS